MKTSKFICFLVGVILLLSAGVSCKPPAAPAESTGLTYVFDGTGYVAKTDSGVTITTTAITKTTTTNAPQTTPYPYTTPTYPTVSPTTNLTTYPTTTTPSVTTTTTTPATTTTTTPTTPATPITVGEAKVTRVIDGDTIEVEIQGKSYRVRYIGIDTPETVHPVIPPQPFGAEATAKNKELVEGKTVRLEKDVSEMDSDGRLLRYIYVGDLCVNAELVKWGYARAAAYPPDTKYASYFLSLENEAKSSQRGIWAKRYVGSKNSDKYHLPSCTWAQKISPENEVWFFSAADAKSKGYTPCGVCKPPEND